MKKVIIVPLVFVFTCFSESEQPQQKFPTGSIFINSTCGQSQSLRNSPSTKTLPQTPPRQPQPVYLQVPQQSLPVPPQQPVIIGNNPSSSNYKFPFDSSHVKGFVTRLIDHCSHFNKTTVALGALALAYGAGWLKLLHASHAVTKKGTWSCWKDNISLDLLIEVPLEDMADELFYAIKLTYESNDLMTPMVQFNLDVEKEIKALEHFLNIHSWLTYTKLSLLFPKQIQLQEQAELKIKRLEYLKRVTLDRMGSYKSVITRDRLTPRSQDITSVFRAS